MTAGRLLLLLPTNAYQVSDFMAAARRLGVAVTVGSNRRQALEGVSEGGTVALDFGDPDRAAAQIAAYDQRHPLAAIVPVDEVTAVVAATAGERLGLPHNSPVAARAAANKHSFRETLADAGLPSPAYVLVGRDDDPQEAARRAPYPCVLKPLVLSGSRGVIRADDADGFAAAFGRIRAILDEPEVRAMGPAAHQILVEAYVPGREVALEGLLDRGWLRVLALFDKPDPLEGPFFEETIYVTPSRLTPADQEKIVAATEAAIGALGLAQGPVHAELRLNDAGAVVIELAARAIGGLCGRVLRFGAGIGLEDLIIRDALGLPIDSLERQGDAAGVMMIPIPKRGILRRVRGLKAAREEVGIEDLVISIPRGQEVVPLPEGKRYLGFIFARAQTAEGAEAALRAAHAWLDVDIEEVVEPAA